MLTEASHSGTFFTGTANEPAGHLYLLADGESEKRRATYQELLPQAVCRGNTIARPSGRGRSRSAGLSAGARLRRGHVRLLHGRAVAVPAIPDRCRAMTAFARSSPTRKPRSCSDRRLIGMVQYMLADARSYSVCNRVATDAPRICRAQAEPCYTRRAHISWRSSDTRPARHPRQRCRGQITRTWCTTSGCCRPG